MTRKIRIDRENRRFSKVSLIGNLTKNPKLCRTPQGMMVGNLSLAVKSEDTNNPILIDVVLVGNAEQIDSYRKGDWVIVEGWLQKNGHKIEVMAQSICKQALARTRMLGI